jgi:hypothetical protein
LQVAEEVPGYRLLKNVQMQGTSFDSFDKLRINSSEE